MGHKNNTPVKQICNMYTNTTPSHKYAVSGTILHKIRTYARIQSIYLSNDQIIRQVDSAYYHVRTTT
jgi:hypothetical protein